jgi:hypothetical protein
MEAILDFNKELDVNLFDSVVNTCLTGTGQDVNKLLFFLLLLREGEKVY